MNDGFWPLAKLDFLQNGCFERPLSVKADVNTISENFPETVTSRMSGLAPEAAVGLE